MSVFTKSGLHHVLPSPFNRSFACGRNAWKTPIDDCWEHTQGTLKKSPVLLSLSNFSPEFMNKDIVKVFDECFNPNECYVDELVQSQAVRYIMYQWWYSPNVPIKPGWDCMSEGCIWFKPSFLNRKQNEKLPSLL